MIGWRKLTVIHYFQLQQIVDELSDPTIFTSPDARSEYWAIPVAHEDRPKTAFSDGVWVFHFYRMPYGLHLRLSSTQLILWLHTAVYDIVVFSRGLLQLLKDLKETFRFDICYWLMTEPRHMWDCSRPLRFKEHIISEEDLLPDRDKESTIAVTTIPKDTKGIRRFRGASRFFRHHIMNYAAISFCPSTM